MFFFMSSVLPLSVNKGSAEVDGWRNSCKFDCASYQHIIKYGKLNGGN